MAVNKCTLVEDKDDTIAATITTALGTYTIKTGTTPSIAVLNTNSSRVRVLILYTES